MDELQRDKKFDQFLSDRYVPDVPSNLSARIIEASRESRVSKFWAFKPLGVLQRFLDSFAIPQPALAFGVFLFLSVGLGVYASGFLADYDTSVVSYAEDGSDVSMAFYLDDIFYTEDML